uniref:polynucleotide adenylyltransferase n=1 Tax=Parascaris univalens TaxID=6257 RepID=A0A914ZPA7_PARUN
MASGDLQQHLLSKFSPITRMNSSREGEEYASSQQRQAVRVSRRTTCPLNKLYSPLTTSGPLLVAASGEKQSLSKVSIGGHATNKNSTGLLGRSRRGHEQQPQRSGRRTSRHPAFNQPNPGAHLFRAEFMQRDLSPSASSSASSGVSSLDSGHGSDCGTHSPVRNSADRRCCDMSWYIGDEHVPAEYATDYTHYYLQQQQQNWYRIQQQPYTGMMAAICAARHAVALQMCRQQKDFYSVFADGRVQAAVPRLEPGIAVGGNLDNGQTSAYATSYFMVPYDVIEAYLRFLESICPQLVQSNQQSVEVSDPPLALSHTASEEASAGEEGIVCRGSSLTATRASSARQFHVDNAVKNAWNSQHVASSGTVASDEMVSSRGLTHTSLEAESNREETESQRSDTVSSTNESSTQHTHSGSSNITCSEEEEKQHLGNVQHVPRPHNLELTSVNVEHYPVLQVAVADDANGTVEGNVEFGSVAQMDTKQECEHLDAAASEEVAAEKLCVARNVSDGQGIESLYWHSNEPLVHARSQSSGDYRDGVLSSSTDNASQGEAVLSAARMSSPTGVVAVDGAVDREESLEEQLVDVVELADPQPAPVNASAANAPRPLRPPPASSFSRSGRFEVSKMDVLSEEIWDFHNTITQSEALLNRKLHLRDMLYCCISPVFPMCGLYVVGSSLNGFGNNSSDMDLCLMISHKDIDQRTDAVVVLGMIKSALINVAWVREQQLIIAKVPILRIKFTEPFTEITVDLNANNSVAIRNTHLLCYYSSFDWRVRPLVSVVKEWAKRRDMNDANRSTFTSYSLVLMVIHYLQCGANPAVLPSLQELYPKRFNHRIDVRTLNVSVPLEPPATGEWQFSEANTLGELLLGFLEYYAFKFDYVHDAISVRLGTKIERSFVARQRSPYNNSIAQWNCICIEEPFTLSNTAHSVHSQMVFDAIREAFVEGFEELDTNRDLNAFLNAPPIKIGANITPHGSGSHLNVLSVTSTDHAGELASCGRMLRRCRNAGDALFVLDTGISESSGHSSALSSPRSTPSSIGEHSCVASSESTDGDLVRSFNDRIIASDQECDGNYAQRERRILATIPPETANASSVLLGERQQEKDVDEARKFGDEKSTKEAKSGNDSQGQMQQQQGRGRRRRNARKIQPSINDYTTARLVEANSGGSVRLGKKPFCSLEAHSS